MSVQTKQANGDELNCCAERSLSSLFCKDSPFSAADKHEDHKLKEKWLQTVLVIEAADRTHGYYRVVARRAYWANSAIVKSRSKDAMGSLSYSTAYVDDNFSKLLAMFMW